MEPFSISCTTCQVRLKVRDASAIGQILTCPKCGSMVLVEAPAHSPAANPATDVKKTPTKTPTPHPKPSSETVDDPTQYGLHSDPGMKAPDAAASPPPSPVPDRDAASTGDEQPLADERLPVADWMSFQQARRRRLLSMAVAGVAGIILAFVILTLGIRWLNPPATVAEKTAPVVTTPSPIDTPPVETPGGLTNPFDSVANDPGGVISPNPETNSPSPTMPPVEPAEPPVDSSTVAEPPAEPTATEPPRAVSDKPTVPGGTSPLDTRPADAVAGGSTLADTLRTLGVLFAESESDSATLPVDAPSTPDVPVPTAPPPITAAEASRLSRPEPLDLIIDERLADPLLAVEIKDQPLLEFLRIMTGLSGIPITLDGEVLPWLRLSPRSKVNVTIGETTVGKALDAGLASVGLSYRATDVGLVVTRNATTADQMRKITISVGDLVGADKTSATEFLRIVKNHTGEAAWMPGESGGSMSLEGETLTIENREAVLFSVVGLCERLRVARGLPLRGKFPPEMFELKTRTEQVDDKLQHRVTATYLRSTRWLRILDRLAETADITLLVDWEAVADEGWNPNAEVSWVAEKETLANALTSLLTPMDLTWQVVSRDAIRITTPKSLDAAKETELHLIGDLMDKGQKPDELIASLRTEVGTGIVVDLDPISRCLLISTSQINQRKITDILVRTRTEKPAE